MRARYFLRTTLCGLRLPMRPLSLPAAGSITALMRVGLPESIPLFTARLHSSGGVTVTPNSAERFDDLVVARVFDEGGRRRVGTAAGIDVGAAVDAVVVEDNDADRKAVAANGFHLHAGEAKGAVAFDCQHGVAGLDRRGDGKPHADAHDDPGADIEAFARLVHVDDAAREIERVGAFVDQGRIRPLFDDGA